MQTIPAGHYKSNPDIGEFPEAEENDEGNVNMYHRYRCQFKLANARTCGFRCRTFCACNPARILCQRCLIEHGKAKC